MAADELIVHGAREHNLKDVTVGCRGTPSSA
jgi:excinuclease UvrABC ATPase subunit